METGPRPESDPPLGERWYACYTRSRHEKRVDALLRDRGLESFLPVVPRLRQWHDREKVVEFPLFPSYVFVRSAPAALGSVQSIPGVVNLVRFNGRPVPVSDEEIESVRRLVRALAKSGGERITLDPFLTEGDEVRIVSGPFEGIRGLLLERRGRNRALVQIGLEAIRQGVRVDVEVDCLRLLHAPGGVSSS